jgi:hypothetical protein
MQRWSAFYRLASRRNINLMWFWPASSLMCGNKMPTRCNKLFLLQSYCLLNMFRAPVCPSSGAREYYTGGCCLWYLVLWFSSCRYGVELRVMCLMMGIVVPETCWASNKICNKNHLLHLVGILFPHRRNMFVMILSVNCRVYIPWLREILQICKPWKICDLFEVWNSSE